MDNVQEERQNETKTVDQNMASCCEQCTKENIPEDEDKIKTKQDIPVAFAIPAPEVRFVLPGKTLLGVFAKETKLYRTTPTQVVFGWILFSVLLKPHFVGM